LGYLGSVRNANHVSNSPEPLDPIWSSMIDRHHFEWRPMTCYFCQLYLVIANDIIDVSADNKCGDYDHYYRFAAQ
jgi:hypothetical protein